MNFTRHHTIGLFDAAHDSTLRLEAMARLFQDMAVSHASEAGVGPEVILPRGLVWYLHRLEIRVRHYPRLGERVAVTTWSRAFRQYMGLREYTITSDRGEVVHAASVWIFFDFERRRIARVPPEMANAFSSDPGTRFENELYRWQPETGIRPEKKTDLSLRFGDFDLNGHVNNTIYPGMVETLGYALADPGGAKGKLRRLRLRLGREIPLGQQGVRAGYREMPGRYCFTLADPADPSVVHADGEFYF